VKNALPGLVDRGLHDIFGAEILGFAILRQNSQELLHQGVTEWL
jgi:hypothetical protein